MRIRTAAREDIEPIAAFTVDTFDWGDYVADRMADWLEDPAMTVLVAVDDGDQPVALARGQMVSPAEAWFGAARVHPDHRGKRIAGDLAYALMDWARGRGAQVGRLAIEDWNEASIRHVGRIGMRKVASFSRCHRSVGDASPLPGGNGGKRVPAALRARPARAAEAEPAYASWSVGELGRAARGLFGLHWVWRRLTIDDLDTAAHDDALWEIGGGWAMAARAADSMEVGWLETRHDDAAEMVRALVDLAVSTGAERLVLWVPTVDWLIRAARTSGCESDSMGIYAIGL